MVIVKKESFLFHQELLWMQRHLLNSKVEKEFVVICESFLWEKQWLRVYENMAHSFSNIVTKAVPLLRINYVI